jgi:hypothetical protein
MTYSQMTRDERRDRIDEIRAWMEEINEEFRDVAFPPDLQTAWDHNYAEMLDHQRQLANIEDRQRLLRDLTRRE